MPARENGGPTVTVDDGFKVTPGSGKRCSRVSEILAAAAGTLTARAESPRLEAEILLAHVLAVDRAVLAARPEAEIPSDEKTRYEALIARRVKGEPVAYLTGTKEFWSMDLEVGCEALIPRPETELLVEAALERIPPEATSRVADLGTGCGAVALAIGRERLRARIVATDVSPRALALARRNLSRWGMTNIRLLRSDWLEAIASPAFDLIVSNPPYVPASDPHLLQGDLPMEPRLALASGPDGLDAIRAIVAAAGSRLSQHGSLLLEHGFDQGPAVRALLQAGGFREVFTLEDYARLERVTGGRV
ncbi:MAG TPA: peptide chain release factor N(5)-glutamine methyltransferase [Gammaproteobacteria bacterium]|nr:peptide chain release factor N(5)-glutamine methyltransferase [Gammaproteobacteria bacterium]